MFIHPHQLQEVVSHFPEVHDYQLIVDRSKDKDEMSLQIEVVSEGLDREGLEAKIGLRFKEILRLDTRVEFILRGTLLPNHKKIEDRRKWD